MAFKSPQEFREVMDRTFELMSTDPEMGPRLRDAETPQRYEFPDLDLVVNITYVTEVVDEQYLRWDWSEEPGWEPEVIMKMDSEVANRYFQGQENVALAIARRRVRTSGNVKKALALLPITKDVFPKYKQMLEEEYPHLLGT